ncbi:MAG: MerR family transcriptional regulator, partial [Lachnospiraceae bacterium]|nr:MerR family transcriptional regulator [Lachnospiraceae bacterium]
MNFDVTVKTIPERYAATVQMIVPTYMDEGMLWSTMMTETAAAGEPLVPSDGCLVGAQFLDPEYK